MTEPAQSTEQDGDVRRHYTADYFRRWNYADRGLGRFSMYWFARRYYASLVRRYAPPRIEGEPHRLLELGSGMGHLLGLLQDDFDCVGVDLIDYAVEQTQQNAPKAEAHQMDVDAVHHHFEPESFAVVVALHLVEHLPDPSATLHRINHLLKPGGLLLFATPHPEYSFRRFKDRTTDAIGKDETHINVHPPQQWRQWCHENGFAVLKHFGDGLWDVPYLPVIPARLQFGLFGLPALLQVMTRTTFTPLALGVNQIAICRKTGQP